MSKLDEIFFRLYRHSEPNGLVEADLRYGKQAIKKLFVEILDTTDVLGPEHPQTNLWYTDLKKKVEEL